jgi:predicted nucleic acid-binding protein
MIERSFLDTNILLYPYDRTEPVKRDIAGATLERLVRSGQAIISTQVLGEFCAVGTRKMKMSPAFAAEQVLRFSKEFHVISVTPEIVLEAVRGVITHRLNFWDAQLWAAARLHQIPLLLTEDFQDGAVLEGVRFTNPFRTDLLT